MTRPNLVDPALWASDLCLAVAFATGLTFSSFSLGSPWIGFAVGLGVALVLTTTSCSIEGKEAG